MKTINRRLRRRWALCTDRPTVPVPDGVGRHAPAQSGTALCILQAAIQSRSILAEMVYLNTLTPGCLSKEEQHR